MKRILLFFLLANCFQLPGMGVLLRKELLDKIEENIKKDLLKIDTISKQLKDAFKLFINYNKKYKMQNKELEEILSRQEPQIKASKLQIKTEQTPPAVTIIKKDLSGYPEPDANILEKFEPYLTSLNIPKHYWKIILNDKKRDILRNPASSIKERRMFLWKAILDQYSIGNELTLREAFGPTTHGYFYLGDTKERESLCNGKSENKSLKDYNKANNKERSGILESLTKDYKIHLMPKGEMVEDLDELITLFLNNKTLRDSVSSFKLLTDLSDEQLKEESKKNPQNVMPKIVIYCAAGKANAQAALNELYKAFKDTEGLNITPRYNKEVTSYLYFAQGNGDDKKIPAFNKFFEQPDMVYYNADITGTRQDYHLQIPNE